MESETRFEFDQTEEEYRSVVREAVKRAMETGERPGDLVRYHSRFSPWGYFTWGLGIAANVGLVFGFHLTGWRMLAVAALAPFIVICVCGQCAPISRHRIELKRP